MTGFARSAPRHSTMSNSRRAASILALCCGLTVFAPQQVHAEDGPESLTIDDFAARVERHLPEYDLLDADILDAEADVESADALPAIGLAFDRQEVFTDGDGVALENAVSLRWSLDVSGRRGLRRDAARGRVRAMRHAGRRARRLIALDALERYLRAARVRLRAESLQSTRAPLVTLVESLGRRVREGDASGADLARFELALASHDDRLAEAEAEARIAERELAALIGEPEGRVRADDRLALPEAASASALTSALAGRADLQAVDEERNSGHALLRASGRWWIPTFEISAGYLNTDLDPGSGPGAGVAHGYLASVSLNLPIFSRARGERKRGEARVRRAEARRKLLERRILRDVQATRERLASRVERVRVHQSRQLVLAEDLVRKTEAAYSGGEATALELRDAYRERVDAELRHIDLRFEARLAALEFERATGKKTTGVSQ